MPCLIYPNGNYTHGSTYSDRDSTRWNLDADETQKRRELMWEIYVYDSWQVGHGGKPDMESYDDLETV